MSSEHLSILVLPHFDCYFLLPSLAYYTLRDIVKLDTAICNSKMKQVFEILPTFYNFEMIKSNAELLWLVMRKVNLTSCHFTFSPTESLGLPYCIYIYKLIGELLCNSLDLIELKCDHVDGRLLTALQEHNPKLLYLYCGETYNITDEMIISFSKSFSGLERLVLYRASKLTDAAIEAIVEYCPEIETLPLGGWDLLTDKTLKALAKLTGLKALHLTGNQGYTNSSIVKVVRNNACIEKLILTFNKGTLYDSTVFRQIAGYCNNLRLLQIDISPPSELASAPSATPSLLLADEDLVPLIRSCPLLESVSVNGMSSLTEMILLELSTHCHLLFSLKLRSYSPFARLSDPPLVTDDSIAALTMGCPKLDTLTLGPCMEITDQGILSIAMRCKRLVHLSLEFNDKITDAGMRVLFESSTQLTTLLNTALS